MSSTTEGRSTHSSDTPGHAFGRASPARLTMGATVGAWIAQVIAAAIMGQTLFFKFSGAPEPIFIFTTLGAEPWGRWGTGVMELIAVVLLLVPRTAIFGAALGAGLMLGAIGSHVTKLGIEVMDDGGLLFGLGVVTLLACAIVLVLRRGQAIDFVRWALTKVSGK